METCELLAKRIMKKAISEDYFQWAEELLLEGENRESIKILAALSLTSPVYWFDVEKCFKDALEELGFEYPDDKTILKKIFKNNCTTNHRW